MLASDYAKSLFRNRTRGLTNVLAAPAITVQIALAFVAKAGASPTVAFMAGVAAVYLASHVTYLMIGIPGQRLGRAAIAEMRDHARSALARPGELRFDAFAEIGRDWPMFNGHPSEGGMDRASRANNFDFLRLFGAILVLYGHSYSLTGCGRV